MSDWALGAGGVRKPGHGGPAAAVRLRRRQKGHRTYDVDKNGYLDAMELEKAPAIQVAFPGSSKVTEADIAARIE